MSWSPQQFIEFKTFDLRRPSSMTNEIILSRTLVSKEKEYQSSRESLEKNKSVEMETSRELQGRPTRTISDKRPQSWTSTTATHCDISLQSRPKSMFASFRKRKKNKKKEQTDRLSKVTDGQTDRASRVGLTEHPSEPDQRDSRPGSLVSEGRPASSVFDQRTSVCTTSSGASSHSNPSSGNNGSVTFSNSYPLSLHVELEHLFLTVK